MTFAILKQLHTSAEGPIDLEFVHSLHSNTHAAVCLELNPKRMHSFFMYTDAYLQPENQILGSRRSSVKNTTLKRHIYSNCITRHVSTWVVMMVMMPSQHCTPIGQLGDTHVVHSIKSKNDMVREMCLTCSDTRNLHTNQ